MFYSPFQEIFGAFLIFSGLYMIIRMPVRKERQKSEALRLLEFAVNFFLGLIFILGGLLYAFVVIC